MALIYKDFAVPLRALNHEALAYHPGAAMAAGPAVRLPGGRGYLRHDFRKEAVQPHFDEIHYGIYDESWYTQEELRDRFAAEPVFHGRVYAGCAGMVNLDYIAAIRAPGVILYDVNPLQTMFWEGLFDLIAALPDRHDCAAMLQPYSESLFYRIDQLHGREVIRDMTPPVREGDRFSFHEGYAPYRRMRYYEVGDRARSMLAKPETWLGDDARYRHLHLLAKHRAVAPLTIDITDRGDCARVAEVLAGLSYLPGRYDGGGAVSFEETPQTGAAVGFLYRSNIGYFLRYSAERLAQAAKYDAELSDYSANPVGKSTYRKAHENLRRWMAPQAYMLASDRLSGPGRWAQFVPRLYDIKGLAGGRTGCAAAKPLASGPQPG